MTETQTHGDNHQAPHTRARILVTYFDGAMDAGASGRMAVEQMLRSLPATHVADFDAEDFINYRSHRPVITVKSWVTEEVETPKISLDLLRDDRGESFLLLHGPEPDYRWETFASRVREIITEAGVEVVFGMTGIPSGVPHTRPTPVHVHTTDPSLVPAQPHMSARIQYPGSMVSFLQWHLKKAGIDGMTLLAIVPYYMSESAYPAASSALLRKLSEFSGLSLPVGDLEQGAAEDFDAFAALVDANPEVQHTVRSLEEHYDSFSGDGLGIPLNAVPSAFTVGLGAEKETEITGISDAIEAYLASVTEGATGNTEPSESDEKVIEEKPSVDDLLAEALKRVAERKEGSDSAVGAHVPRHRGSASAAEDSPERAEGPAPESQEGSAE
jgi:hypothetical protein